jgi:hypothetical protein
MARLGFYTTGKYRKLKSQIDRNMMADNGCPVCGARPIPELLAVTSITQVEWVTRHKCDPFNLVNSRYGYKDIAVTKAENEKYDVLIDGNIVRFHCNADDALRALNIYIRDLERLRRCKSETDAFNEEFNRKQSQENNRRRENWYLIGLIAAFAYGAGWFDPIIRALSAKY